MSREPKTPGGSRRRWIIGSLIVLLAFFALGIAGAWYASKRLSPLMEVEDNGTHVRFLGGLIDIDSGHGKVTFAGKEFKPKDGGFNLSFSTGDLMAVDGTLEAKDLKEFSLDADRGRMEFKAGDPGVLRYRCRIRKEPGGSKPSLGESEFKHAPGGKWSLDLRTTGAEACTFEVPSGVALRSQVIEGELIFKGVAQDVKGTLKRGRLVFAPKDLADYRLDAHIQQGIMNLTQKEIHFHPPHHAELTVEQGMITQ
ncbi:MAG TPA: hypothetical protein VL588_01845 [Bdellovibrionota bacterium]|jgi:hypothetical protein|nr:hypothetical protein [Bdellovibrionota bacterium]